MPRLTIDPARTALLIIDMSNDFLAPGAPVEAPAGRQVIPALQRLAVRCREMKMPVVFTTHAHRADGSDLGRMGDQFPFLRKGRALVAGTPGVDFYPEMAPQPGDLIVEKHRFNAFVGTDLDMLLRNKGVDTVIIGGVCTNICCESTAREAMFRDYHVIFLSDGNATFDIPDRGFGAVPNQEAHRMVLANIAAFFGTVLSVDEVLTQLR